MEKKRNMTIFLVKNFLYVMLCIAICQLAISILYSYLVFPYLQKWVGGPFFDNFTLSHWNVGTLYVMFLWLFVEGILSLLPRVVSQSVHQFLDRYFDGKIPQEIGSILHGNSREVLNLYYVGCFIILLVLILIALLPYIVGALRFSRLIRRELDELMGEEKRQHLEYEKRRSLMLSDIAHDLKTPITTVNGYAMALRDGVVTDEKKKQQYLNAICNKSQRLDDLISLLFEYVKIDSEGFSLHKEQTDIVELLRENIALSYPDFERKGIEMDLEIPEECIYWDLDRIQFSRALANLLNNELRHVERGESVVVRLRWDEEMERVRILFGDTGAQIEDEVAKHIFEPFVMGDASRSTKGGSGLGLSISSKIVRMHGGRLLLDRNSTKEYVKAFVIVLR